MTGRDEIDRMLRPLAPVLSNEADAILDLRQLLISQGHPGKCVRCFFHLFEAAGESRRLHFGALRAWLEAHVEILVSHENRELEVLPLALGQDSLETCCLQIMETIRLDRGYGGSRLQLNFRYKAAA